MLDYRGLLERFRKEATWAGPIPRFSFGSLQLDFSRLGVSPLHILAIPQRRLERLLDERLRELGGSIRRGHELTALSQDDDGVTLDARGPEGGYRLGARYLVGCDGAQPGAQAGGHRLPRRYLVGDIPHRAGVPAPRGDNAPRPRGGGAGGGPAEVPGAGPHAAPRLLARAAGHAGPPRQARHLHRLHQP